MIFVMEELNGIQNRIYEVRGVRVMLDFDLAALYQVETRVLKQAVRRNLDRFPEDFMFEVTEYEYNSLIISLRSQFVISNDRGGRRYMPYAFTEHGTIMLASLLRSEISAIYEAIAALSVKIQPPTGQPRQKIGYKTSADEKK